MDQSSIEVHLAQGSFLVSGTEAFVENHYPDLLDLIQSQKPAEALPAESSTASGLANSNTVADELKKYIDNGVIHIDRETGIPQILSAVPGKNNKEKMQNVARIVLFAHGDKEVGSKEVKEQCERQSCLDSPNFAKSFVKNTDFIKKGVTGSSLWTLQLTVPGKKAAIALLDSMCTGTV
jgi:hypothetical protein